jgi:hypothetical protein
VVRAAPAARPSRSFQLTYWWGPPRDHNSPQSFKDVAAAGFTLAGYREGYTHADNLALLDNAQQAGLTGIVGDDATPDLAAHPALGMYFIDDEPTMDGLGNEAAAFAAHRRVDPAHESYLNLCSAWCPFQGSQTSASYDDYLEAVMRIVQPPVLSFDHYIFQNDGTDRGGWYETLEAIRRAALRHSVPAWAIIQGVGGFDNYRAPSDGEMRYQAYSALAYGMKGISFFLYWPEPTLGMTAAIVDSSGRPTAQYAKVQSLNRQLAVLGPQMFPLVSDAGYHTGPLPDFTQPPPADTVINLPRDVALVLGIFHDPQGDTHAGTYGMVVNRDHENAVSVTARLGHGFTHVFQRLATCAGEVAVPLSPASPASPASNAFVISLLPGEGKLYRAQ